MTSRLRPKRPRTGSASRYAGLVSSTLIPTSRGTASGQAASNRPRVAPGSVHSGTSIDAERVRQLRRQEVGQAEDHDAEVLGQVARILDGPVGVVAEARVARGLEPVQVVVGRAGSAGRS